MSLFYHELIHLLLTFLVAIFIWVRFYKRKLNTTRQLPITNYWLLFTGIFLIGIFLDIDHLFDYFMWSKGAFILKDFLNPSLYVHLSGKVYVPFHGFEFIPLIWIIAKNAEGKLKAPNLALAITLSYAIHLLWDNFSFSHHPFAYFFIHRLINGFSVGSFDGY